VHKRVLTLAIGVVVFAMLGRTCWLISKSLECRARRQIRRNCSRGVPGERLGWSTRQQQGARGRPPTQVAGERCSDGWTDKTEFRLAQRGIVSLTSSRQCGPADSHSRS